MSSKHRDKTWSAAAETDVIMTTGWNLMSLQVTSVGVGGQFTFDGSNDGGATWVSISAIKIDGTRITPVVATGFYFIPATFDLVRITLSALTSGTPKTSLTLRDSALADLLIALGAGSGDASAANQATMIAALGAPADAAVTNPASSGSIIAFAKGILTKVALMVFGAGTAAAAQRTTLASDDPLVAVAGATSGAKVTTDSNGTIQQYLRGAVTQLASLLTQLGTLVFGPGTAAAAQRTTLASDDPLVAVAGATSGAKVTTDIAGTIQQYLRGAVTQLATLITNCGTLVFGAGTAAAAQRATLASDDPLVTVAGSTSGAKVITDSNGTIQQYLRGAVTQLASLLTQLGTQVFGTGTAAAALRVITADDGGPTSTARLLSAAASTNSTSVKGSAGVLYGVKGVNVSASAKYLKIYNKASAPTVGTDTPIMTIALPATSVGGGFFDYPWPAGRYFATGIGYAITGASADADTTNLTAGDIIDFNMDYR